MNVAWMRNIGSFIRVVAGLANFSVTAGGTNDNTALTGITVDRNDLVPNVLSGVFAVIFNPTLAASNTVAVSCVFEDSADGSSWATYDAGPGSNTATEVIDTGGAQTLQFKAQLGGARRYIRAKPKFDMSATGTDTTAVLGGVWIVGGADELPIADA